MFSGDLEVSIMDDHVLNTPLTSFDITMESGRGEARLIYVRGDYLTTAFTLGRGLKVKEWLLKHNINGRKAFNTRPVLEQVTFYQQIHRKKDPTGRDMCPFDLPPWHSR
jgi:hypothetical protein